MSAGIVGNVYKNRAIVENRLRPGGAPNEVVSSHAVYSPVSNPIMIHLLLVSAIFASPMHSHYVKV